VLAPFGRGVDLSQRQARFVSEVPFEESMGTDDLKREALSVRAQFEHLPINPEQFLRLHSTHELDRGRVGKMKRTRERGQRCSPPSVLLLEQVFQGVLGVLPLEQWPIPAPHHERGGGGREKQPSRDGRHHLFRFLDCKFNIGKKNILTSRKLRIARRQR